MSQNQTQSKPDTIEEPRGEGLDGMPCSASCYHCDGTGAVDSGGVTPWGAGIDVMCPACKGSGTLEIENCPNCDNVGWYMVPDSEGQPTMEQCQWCYTVPNSRFIHWVNSGASEEHPFCKPNGILNFKL
jgi:hypothetical protein